MLPAALSAARDLRPVHELVMLRNGPFPGSLLCFGVGIANFQELFVSRINPPLHLAFVVLPCCSPILKTRNVAHAAVDGDPVLLLSAEESNSATVRPLC